MEKVADDSVGKAPRRGRPLGAKIWLAMSLVVAVVIFDLVNSVLIRPRWTYCFGDRAPATA